MSRSAASGLARLARFRADGLEAFEASPVALLNALAPWVAFALVGFALGLRDGERLSAVSGLLQVAVLLLVPLVLSQALAQAWGRAEAWLRYAVAITWCQWAIPPALLAAVLASGVLMAAGVPERLAETAADLAVGGYALALHLFVTRRGLSLSVWRAAAVVAAVDLATVALFAGPILLGDGWGMGG